MHGRAFGYVKSVVAGLDIGTDADIAELGSYDVNGSVRPLFTSVGSYTGIDIRGGKGVDEVADAAEWGEDASYGVVVSTEALEHAENAVDIVTNAYRILEPGGVFILTAAGPDRMPHGNDGGAVGDEFYRNIQPEELTAWFESAGFSDFSIDLTPDRADLQAVAWKAAKKSRAKS